MDIRTIKDSSGNNRLTQLLAQLPDGTKVYNEIHTTVIAAFFNFDSLDASAQWYESMTAFNEAHPDALNELGMELPEVKAVKTSTITLTFEDHIMVENALHSARTSPLISSQRVAEIINLLKRLAVARQSAGL